MIYYSEVALLIFTFLLAGKDADAYSLFSFSDRVKTQEKLKAWHIKGAIIWAGIVAILYFIAGWKIIPAGILIRVSLYDIIFNKMAGLETHAIGTTAFWDKQFSKIFGVNGAIKKLIVFILILIALNILNYAFR